MTKLIFMNYRREDAQSAAGRLFDMLESQLGPDQVFLDVDNIAPGKDFAEELSLQVSKCDVFLAVIGRHWEDAKDSNGGRRIDNPNDWVRIEIEAALQQSKNLIPVLVDGANMPRPEILPESLRPLARRNAVRLTHERFKADASGLVAAIEKLRRNRAQQHEKVNALLEQPELSSVLSAVTFYSDADKYRAVLVSNDEASADLCIFREGSLLDEDVPFERAVLKRNAAWCGRMAGTQPWLEVDDQGRLQMCSGNEAIGRHRWAQTLTITYRADEFIVARVTYEERDTLNPEAGGSYDINFLKRKGKRNGKSIAVIAAAPTLAAWSDEERPIECFV
jgi:hypothetical protein